MLRGNVNVFVEGDRIVEISERPAADGDEVVDCGGRVLMPGLIDAHVHVYAAGLNIVRVVQSLDVLPGALRGAVYAREPGSWVHDSPRCWRRRHWPGSGHQDGLLDRVPRLFYGGRVISQTGGHGDFRPGDHSLEAGHFCGCSYHADQMAVIADGADAVRKAVREELRRGAAHIKIMASGGVASPTDPIDRCQYSDEEIRAAVEEADRAGSYVAAHCHPKEAVRRAAALGVKSISRARLSTSHRSSDRRTMSAEKGAFTVPHDGGPLWPARKRDESLAFPRPA